MATKKLRAVGQKAAVWENPLVPHRRLREMYAAMLGARLLDEWLARQGSQGRGRGKKVAWSSTRGEEAARVSTLVGLEKGDLVIDPTTSVTTNYLLGASGQSLAKAARGLKGTALEDGRRGRRLELGELRDLGAEDLLRLAVGAALALKTQGARRAVVALVAGEGVSATAFATILATAARSEAPLVFLVLPGEAKPGVLSARASRVGVPGIAVEAGDAVALYRVAQESLVRIRMGGGPVLMECVRFGRRRPDYEDPIDAMRAVLLAKGAADEAWTERVGARLGTRLLGELEAEDV